MYTHPGTRELQEQPRRARPDGALGGPVRPGPIVCSYVRMCIYIYIYIYTHNCITSTTTAATTTTNNNDDNNDNNN